MDIFLNPELNKFVKSIIGNYGDGKDLFVEIKIYHTDLINTINLIEDHQLDIEELHRALQNPKILRAIQEIKNKSPKKYFGTTPSSIYLSSETTTVSKTTGIINILTTTTELITELKLERNDNSKNSRRRKMKNMFKLNTPVIPTIRS